MTETARSFHHEAPDPEAVAAMVAAIVALQAPRAADEPESQWERRYRADRPWAAASPDWRARRNNVISE